MEKAAVWAAIHDERKALAADLEGISDLEWATRSMCSEWAVRDVIAHMTATSKLSSVSFFPKLIGSGFRLTKLQTKDIVRERGGSGPEALERFKAQLDSTGRPPGPLETMLGEVILHAADIRRPLGIEHTYEPEALIQTADFYKGSNLILATKRRIAGVTLQATDLDWSHGDGPAVAGPMISLLLAMTGRKDALDELDGEGVAVLSSR